MEHNEDLIIIFPKGIPGFEEEKAFLFQEEAETHLAQMDSVTHPEIGFVLLRPQVFFPDYLQKVELSSEETQLLEITDDQKVDVWVIMTLCLSNMAKTTANLRAPLLMNTTTQKGIQIILNDEDYSARQPIFGEEATRSAGADSGEGAVG